MEEVPEYATFWGAVWHIWTLCLGNPETGSYNLPMYIEDPSLAS